MNTTKIEGIKRCRIGINRRTKDRITQTKDEYHSPLETTTTPLQP